MKHIHPTALINKDALIEDEVIIGPYSIIEGNVQIKNGSTIGSFCHLGLKNAFTKNNPLILGKDCLIRSHSTIYGMNDISDGLTTGHYVSIRDNSAIVTCCQIGSYSELQGDCIIEDYVKMQSNVFIPKGTVIRQYARISPHVRFTNDPTPPSDTLLGIHVGEFACIGANATILPGITIGPHALVAAHSCVTKDVKPGKVVRGVPAYESGSVSDVKRHNTDAPAYPWCLHFERGYPDKMKEIGTMMWEDVNVK